MALNATTIGLHPLSLVAALQESLGSALLVASLATVAGLLPGHLDGGLWPLYIPEHFGPRNSQHLLDPYSFVHFGHGIISFYFWGHEDFDNGIIQADKVSGKSGGLAKTLVAAVGFEMIENTELLINLFRENSGTSESYRGDSKINVFGDLFSCALGYNFAKIIASNFPSLYLVPLAVFLAIEVLLAVTIRDNMALIILQLLIPNERIKKWQQEVIFAKSGFWELQKNSVELDLSGYWLNKYSSKKFKRYSR